MQRLQITYAGDKWKRVPRNAPCPCGSGKKFKHCHLAAKREADQKLALAATQAAVNEILASIPPLEHAC